MVSTTQRRIFGVLAGCLTAVSLAITFTFMVRRLWPEYVAAEPTKAYSLAMLLARLTVGALCMIGASLVATRIARDRGTAALWLGGLVFALSLPEHLGRVWADYPAWYHVVYLSYLLPVTGLTGRVASRRADRRR